LVGYSETAEGSRYAFITGVNGEGMTGFNSLVNRPDGVILRVLGASTTMGK
jgi:hypothetical protein